MEIEETQSGSFMEALRGKPSGPVTADQINQELDEATGGKSQPTTPEFIWSLDDNDLLTVYGALSVYLRVLTSQENPDLEMLARTVRLLGRIKPRAVEASRR